MEYSHVTHALTPFSPTPTLVFTTLHPKSNGFFSLFLEDYNYTKTLSFFLIPSNWRSNAYHIYCEMVFLGWFLNIFEIVFTL
jgi:hypothetical protein